MDFTAITVDILKSLAHITGNNYGLAIILLTIAVRMCMWSLNASQQRSMKKMQMLQPKLKEIQTRYKSDPQKMQQKMMEFYKENKFNPMGGCLPLLIQMPVFILLYAALMSPQFIQAAGDSSFMFIKRLDSTMKTHNGVVNDGKFGVAQNDNFATEKTIKVTLKNGEVRDVKIANPKNSIKIQGDLVPGQPVDLKISLDDINLPFSELDKIKSATAPVINNVTKEVETLTFERKDNVLAVNVPTVLVKATVHYDVLVLVILFGLTMFASQKIMMATSNNVAADPTQQAMQETMANIMPLMVTGMFVFFPIPAGVLLYMVVSNVIQVAQTVVINKQLDAEEAQKLNVINDNSVLTAKKATAKKVETVSEKAKD